MRGGAHIRTSRCNWTAPWQKRRSTRRRPAAEQTQYPAHERCARLRQCALWILSRLEPHGLPCLLRKTARPHVGSPPGPLVPLTRWLTTDHDDQRRGRGNRRGRRSTRRRDAAVDSAISRGRTTAAGLFVVRPRLAAPHLGLRGRPTASSVSPRVFESSRTVSACSAVSAFIVVVRGTDSAWTHH